MAQLNFLYVSQLALFIIKLSKTFFFLRSGEGSEMKKLLTKSNWNSMQIITIIKNFKNWCIWVQHYPSLEIVSFAYWIKCNLCNDNPRPILTLVNVTHPCLLSCPHVSLQLSTLPCSFPQPLQRLLPRIRWM